MDLLQWVKLKWQGEEKNLKNKMPRKTDAELLEELERTQKELKKAKKELGKEEGEEYSSEPYDEDEENSDDEVPDIEPAKKKAPPVQVVEREISLSLLNDKLNFIISKVQGLK